MVPRRDRPVCLPRRPAMPVLDKKIRKGFAELAKFGRYHPQLSDAVHLARAFPDTTIILNHVGHVLGVGPSAVHHQEILAAWRKDTNEFAKCPNVCVKLGGIGMTHSASTSISVNLHA
jgi:L-fuconolactonase